MDSISAADVVMIILTSLFIVGMFAPAILHRIKARKNVGRVEQAPEELEEHRLEQPKDQQEKRSRLAA